MNLELHILQNFAPSNLNRDDTGSPKSCEFGGYRRARISSQCLKRAIRNEFRNADLLPEVNRAERTKRLLSLVAERLVAAGRNPKTAEAVVLTTLGALELAVVPVPDSEVDLADAAARKEYFDKQKTEYLIYAGNAEIDRLTAFCSENWDGLAGVATAADLKGRDAKKAAQAAGAKALSKKVVDGFKKSLDGGKAVDLALFGRMLADLPERNVNAASQVAHAISTHAVGLEFDYYTAIDDLKPEDTAGADMIGTVEFNSACYYRYANVDLGQLGENLHGDRDLLDAAVRAFLLASRDAEPTGKQNSFAARNKPSFVFAVLRDSGSWSLANAFARPVRTRFDDDDIAELSANALARHWTDLVGMYDAPAGLTAVACGLGDLASAAFGSTEGVEVVPSYRDLVERVAVAAASTPGGA